MSDGTRINQWSGGDLISTDDLADGSGKVQRVKPQFGDDGYATDVSRLNPFPVQLEEVISLLKTNNALLRAISFQLSFLNSPRANIDDLSPFYEIKE